MIFEVFEKKVGNRIDYIFDIGAEKYLKILKILVHEWQIYRHRPEKSHISRSLETRFESESFESLINFLAFLVQKL